MNQTIYIDYNGKKIAIIISECSEPEYREEWGIHVFCEQANLDQDYMLQDLWWLLKIIPDLIDQQRALKKSDFIRFRLSNEEKQKVINVAKKKWYSSISAYLRSLILE